MPFSIDPIEWRLIAPFAFALIALGGCEQPAAPSASPPPADVSVFEVQPQRLAISTELAGRTAAYQVADVRPQVSGIIQRRLFTEGSEVKAGMPLYQIDAATYQAAWNSARATLAKAQAMLLTTQPKVARYKALLAVEGVSQQDYDDAQAAQQQALADVESAKAAVEAARINLQYTQVLAPISGRIGKSSVTAGALVTAEQAAALTSVSQLDPIYVDVTQSSTDLLRLKRDLAQGQLKQVAANQASVKLILEDGSAYALPGRLQFSDVTVDENTGAVTVRAVFPNPKQQLLPGMYVRAVLEQGVDEHAMLVPQKGITRNAQGQATALLLGADGKVQARDLQTAGTVGDQWRVVGGLSAGERVIVEGVQKVRVGGSAIAGHVQRANASAVPAVQATPLPGKD